MNFLEYGVHWIGFLQKHFPECEDTKDMQIFFEGVIKHSEDKLSEQIEMWYVNMTTPLNSKKTKYAKAIERITKTTPCIYHALVYRDVNALETNHKSNACKQINLFEKCRDERLTEQDQQTIWRYLDKISVACFEAKEVALPVVPTRSEIQENIRSKRDKTEEGPSMQKAFNTHINGLCKHIGVQSPLENCDEVTLKKWMSRWHNFSRDSTDGSKNSALCSQKDVRIIDVLIQTFPELCLTDKKFDEAVWKNINQLNGFSAVSENIPHNMMGRIEDMASRLANDIVEGRTDIASVNLSDIGQQVLSGCTEEDMSKFAGNIDSLLPALGALQQGKS
jgi:hypothetical protein